jgi:hypothetical protein
MRDTTLLRPRKTPGHIRPGLGLATIAAVVALALVACGSSDPNASAKAPPPAPTKPALQYVAFGDSWPEGDHCGRCTTFAGLWAKDLEQETGRKVDFTDFTGGAEHSDQRSKGSSSLLDALRSDDETRMKVRGADVILVATGPNDAEDAFGKVFAGHCGGADHLTCVRDLGQMWHRNFDAILTEIRALRTDKPATIRLVNADNPFLSDPGMSAGMPPGFATGGGALIFKLLTDAMCDAAATHAAKCIDVRPVLNGPNLDQPVDENSAHSMQAVANALRDSGLPELK